MRTFYLKAEAGEDVLRARDFLTRGFIRGNRGEAFTVKVGLYSREVVITPTAITCAIYEIGSTTPLVTLTEASPTTITDAQFKTGTPHASFDFSGVNLPVFAVPDYYMLAVSGTVTGPLTSIYQYHRIYFQ